MQKIEKTMQTKKEQNEEDVKILKAIFETLCADSLISVEQLGRIFLFLQEDGNASSGHIQQV